MGNVNQVDYRTVTKFMREERASSLKIESFVYL